MSLEFEYSANPAKIIFGQGVLSRTGEMIEALGCRRALVLATNFQKPDAEALAAEIGDQCAGVFGEAAMHPPLTSPKKHWHSQR